MSLSKGFDPPQISIKERPQSVNSFYQQNFQNHARFRYFQSYPRYPLVTQNPGKGSQALVAAGMQQQQKQIFQQQQLKQQQAYPNLYPGRLQQPHNMQQQQQHFIQHSQLQSVNNRTENAQALRVNQNQNGLVLGRTEIKQEIVDSLVESMDTEPIVPRFNTNKCLSHKLPSLPPLYSKEVLRKTSNLNVKLRPDQTKNTEPDKRVLTSLQHYQTMSVNNPASVMKSQSHMMTSNSYMKNSFQGLKTNTTSHQSIKRKPAYLLNGSRLHSLLMKGGNPGAERTISRIPQSQALSLDRVRGSLTALAPTLALAPKKRRRRRGNEEPGVKYCHICGELASSHSYYGAQVRLSWPGARGSGHDDELCRGRALLNISMKRKKDVKF